MSFSCTLHPVDQRVINALMDHLRDGRADWHFFKHLWYKKKLINQVNQPFKLGLKELLAEDPSFNPLIQLWSRPFLIYDNDPAMVAQKIAEYYGAARLEDIKRIFLKELSKFSEAAYWAKVKAKYPRIKEPRLGLNEVLAEVHWSFKAEDYKKAATESGFILAQLLSVAYPYWCSRELGLSFLKDFTDLGWDDEPTGQAGIFNQLPELAPYLPSRLKRNLTAGIYLSPIEVRELGKIVERDQGIWIQKIQAKQIDHDTVVNLLQTVREVLAYAKEQHFGVLEASDIIEPGKVRYP